MPSSYNGWTAGPGWSVKGGQLEPLVVAGEPFSPGVRKGDVATVLRYVAEQLHKRVEPITKGHGADDWGYAYRANVNNPSQLSCHASGTAIDYNAVLHPNGRRGTWTPAQKAEIGRILGEVGGTVRNLAHDEMHFEIVGSATAVAAAARKIRGGPPAPSGPAAAGDGVLELGDTGDSVRQLQIVLNRWYPNLPPLLPDGDFGPATDARLRHAQGRLGLTVDGIAGPQTLKALGIAGLR